MALLRLCLAVCLAAGLLPGASKHDPWRNKSNRPASGSSAKAWYKKARQAEKSGNLSQAYIHYAQAAALDPRNTTDAWARSIALRTRALAQAEYLPSGLDEGDETDGDASEELDGLLGSISPEELESARNLAPPLELAVAAGKRSFDLKGNAEELFEAVAPACGLEVVFDGDFEPGRAVRLQIDDAACRDALRIVSAATGAFIVPVSESIFLVAKDSPQKRQELAHNMAVVIPIPEAVSLQEAQELAQAVQQVMELKKLVVDGNRNLVLVRDRVSRVRQAQALFEYLLHSRPEVVIEVEFLEITDTSSLRYGFDWVKSISLAFLGVPGMAGVWPLASAITSNLWGFTIGNAELVASMSRSSSRTLMRSQLRSASGQPATLHIGDRYPIQTNAYIGPGATTSSPTTGGGAGTVYRPPPQINFEDLGVVLKITPFVHGTEEVSLEVEAEFRVLGGEALNGLPVISNRTFQAGVRMRTDEWAIMSGLMRTSEAKNIAGLAGLSDIPYLGKLFSVTTTDKEDSRTVLVIKPRIVRAPFTGVIPEIWSGTETRPVSVM